MTARMTVLPGCNLLASRVVPAVAMVPVPAPAVLVFSNESADMAEVYAVRPGGSQLRLGNVEAGRTAELKVPVTTLGGDGTVSFRARIFARPRVAPTSVEVPLREGERVAVRLPADLKLLAVVPPRSR